MVVITLGHGLIDNFGMCKCPIFFAKRELINPQSEQMLFGLRVKFLFGGITSLRNLASKSRDVLNTLAE